MTEANMSNKETEEKIDNLIARLRVLEDIEAIKQLHYRYVNLLNLTKWDEVMNFFSENSILDLDEVDGPQKGLKAIERYFKEEVGAYHKGQEGNFAAHPIITISGDKGKGNWIYYCMLPHPKTHQSLFWIQGMYDCEYERANGQWKFSLLKWRGRLGMDKELNLLRRKLMSL
jgi:hypothetical protein